MRHKKDFHVPSRISEEIRRRIQVSVAAYAYEVMDDPIMDDATFDAECLKVDPTIDTSYRGRDNTKIDKWFRENFNPSTGQWVRHHPGMDRLEELYYERKTN